jgi:hypothetical protein
MAIIYLNLKFFLIIIGYQKQECIFAKSNREKYLADFVCKIKLKKNENIYIYV